MLLPSRVFIFLGMCFAGLHPVISQTRKEIPRDTSYTPYSVWQQIRYDFPEAKIVEPHVPEGVQASYDIVYAHLPNTPFGPRGLHLDIFRPENKKAYPALILVHGGGWVTGNKSMQIPMAQAIAAKGFVTATVEYQLADEAKYPAAVHNIKAAIRWMRANAGKWGIDTAHIAISGCSAGGQLAALAGMTNGVEQFEGAQGNNDYSSDIQAVIDIDGVVDFLAPASLLIKRKPNTYDLKWFGGSFEEMPKTWMDASPAFWANEKSPPIMFINSGYPRFHAGQSEMLEGLNRWGVYNEVHVVDVKVHPFWLFDPWFSPTVEYITDFLRKTFSK